jgi:hypothetical protein
LGGGGGLGIMLSCTLGCFTPWWRKGTCVCVCVPKPLSGIWLSFLCLTACSLVPISTELPSSKGEYRILPDITPYMLVLLFELNTVFLCKFIFWSAVNKCPAHCNWRPHHNFHQSLTLDPNLVTLNQDLSFRFCTLNVFLSISWHVRAFLCDFYLWNFPVKCWHVFMFRPAMVTCECLTLRVRTSTILGKE